MTIMETIENVKASFEMEDMQMSEEDKRRGISLLSGERTIDDIIAEIRQKYVSNSECI